MSTSPNQSPRIFILVALIVVALGLGVQIVLAQTGLEPGPQDGGNVFVDAARFFEFLGSIIGRVTEAIQRAIAENMNRLTEENERIKQMTGIDLGAIVGALLRLWIGALEWFLQVLRGLIPAD